MVPYIKNVHEKLPSKTEYNRFIAAAMKIGHTCIM